MESILKIRNFLHHWLLLPPTQILKFLSTSKVHRRRFDNSTSARDNNLNSISFNERSKPATKRSRSQSANVSGSMSPGELCSQSEEAEFQRLMALGGRKACDRNAPSTSGGLSPLTGPARRNTPPLKPPSMSRNTLKIRSKQSQTSLDDEVRQREKCCCTFVSD